LKSVGWILDVYVEGGGAVTWLRTAEGSHLKLLDEYRPSIYALPRKGFEDDALNALRDNPNFRSVSLEDKCINLEGERAKVLHVILDGLKGYRRALNAVEALPQIQEIYNADLLHVQQYLFTGLGVPPTSKVEVEHEGDRLTGLKALDDSKEVLPPPFTILFFDVDVKSPFLTWRVERDPISSITGHCGGEEFGLRGDEAEVLEGFRTLVREKDPDMLVCPECDEFTFPYLFTRAELLGLDMQLGRDVAEPPSFRRTLPCWVRGRVAIGNEMYGAQASTRSEDWSLAGLVERARFSFLPPGIAGRWASNRVIDSRNCYELMKRGYVIPRNRGHYEYVRTMEEIVARDRGGLIMAPKIGVVHENVAELDFASQYPNLIVRDNLSYETVTPEGVKASADAILPYVTKSFLERRLYFKGLKGNYAEDGPEWNACEQRQQSLKLILVCLYGTSGCCWNRFGNVLCFEEINRRSREAMMVAKDCAQEGGFEVVYGDTDSIFVKRGGATKGDYEGLGQEIGRRTGLPIGLDHHYKFLVLLPLEADPDGNMEAQKHYFGVLTNGELVARGIEMRRHDTPPFIREFQRDLILALLNVGSHERVRTEGYDRARELISESIRKVMGAEVPIGDLVVSKILRRPLSTYARASSHVSAAIRLADKGKTVKEGESVEFVYVDAKHHNPLCRVAPIETYRGKGYDEEKYRELLIDAAETVLSTFGFSRQEFGSKTRREDYRDLVLSEMDGEMQLEKETESMASQP